MNDTFNAMVFKSDRNIYFHQEMQRFCFLSGESSALFVVLSYLKETGPQAFLSIPLPVDHRGQNIKKFIVM